MIFLRLAIALAGAQQAAAHFRIDYPPWRADTFNEAQNWTQWTWPCGGVPDGYANRTEWPLQGGAVALTLRHPWTYLFINLGLGNAVTNFNMSLAPELMNVSGRGPFCIDNMFVPMHITDGTNASIQVVTSGGGDSGEGSSLYNCADITFRAAAKVPDNICTNGTGMKVTMLGEQWAPPNATVTVTAMASTPTAKPNSAIATTADGVAFIAVIALACAFATALAAVSVIIAGAPENKRSLIQSQSVATIYPSRSASGLLLNVSSLSATRWGSGQPDSIF
ncbi:hypothetical protein F4804DRAFT_334257 [Jackrogersella minutella]|nr:hypothetical protein F4804DRAFT_334257 [Jackrogersella minutella]